MILDYFFYTHTVNSCFRRRLEEQIISTFCTLFVVFLDNRCIGEERMPEAKGVCV